MAEIFQPGDLFIADAWGKASLIFNSNFVSKWDGKFTATQQYIDSEVLRLCEPYIPKLTGMLIASGITGTKIGAGEVSWTTPYARRQYMSPRAPGSATGPLRGPHWFERMKAVHGETIITGARKLFSETP